MIQSLKPLIYYFTGALLTLIWAFLTFGIAVLGVPSLTWCYFTGERGLAEQFIFAVYENYSNLILAIKCWANE